MTVVEDRLMRPRETAEMLNVAVSTLKAWRNREYGPRYKRLPGDRGEIRYLLSEVLGFMASEQFGTYAEELAARTPDGADRSPSEPGKWWVK